MAMSPEKLQRIQAAKAPIATVLDRLHQLKSEEEQIVQSLSPYIATLVKEAKRPGPFSFGGKDYYFRKSGAGDDTWRIKEESESL